MAVTLHTGVRTATVSAEWSVWDTRCRLVITDPWALYRCRAVLEEQLTAVDRAARPRRRHRDGVAFPLTSQLAAVRDRAGDCGIGPFPYGLTSAPVSAPVHRPAPEPALDTARPRSVLHMGPGGSVTAWAAQRCAEAVAEHARCGALVSIGDDVATSGLAPVGGWRIALGEEPGAAPAVIVIDGGAVSRISTADAGQRQLRRIVVAATGRTAHPRWRSVTVVAATATAASAACAGAMLRGGAAPGWLADLGVPGRLIDADGRVRTLDRWPARDPRREQHQRRA